MNETPKNRKFGLLKFPFALREEVIRNMEFMDAFNFSTLSKRSKRLVLNAKLRTHSITFCIDCLLAKDMIRVETIKDGKCAMISLADPNKPLKRRNPDVIDGVNLASLINEPSDDYRKKLSAYILSISHFNWTNVHIERDFANVHFERDYVEPLTEFFLWDVRKKFDSIRVGRGSLSMSSEVLKFLLETIKSNQYYLGIRIIEANFKYRKSLDCETLSALHSVQWLDTYGILQRNPKMKKLHLEGLEGEQINDLLKQWINGQVTDLESLIGYKRYNFPADDVLDGIVTLDPTITHEQAKGVYDRQEIIGQLVDIQRKVDGQLATVLLNEKECFAIMWNEKRLAELGN
ncbi:hypothetical protein B9Z55_013815 [Caenorhabditis nigoni]|uniref:F-box domain-containing protein n=1 Tax=Caenorhabditis nigoni TaxID=1611254 RepID=A0A2G5U3C5_9PELO|nr:hypothetical protein B9Z55_013815 [Caenorhabditis nigoni]